jgi:acyl carrier protein
MGIRRSIRNYILENILFTDDESALVDGDSFLAKGMIDSTGVLEIMYFVEEAFGITVDDEEMLPENLDSVDSLVSFVNRKHALAA